MTFLRNLDRFHVIIIHNNMDESHKICQEFVMF